MDRRGFIKLTGAALAGAFVGPSLILEPPKVVAGTSYQPSGFPPLYYDNLFIEELRRLGHPIASQSPWPRVIDIPPGYGTLYTQPVMYHFKGNLRCRRAQTTIRKYAAAYRLSDVLTRTSRTDIITLAICDIARDLSYKLKQDRAYALLDGWGKVIIKSVGCYAHDPVCMPYSTTVGCKLFAVPLNDYRWVAA